MEKVKDGGGEVVHVGGRRVRTLRSSHLRPARARDPVKSYCLGGGGQIII